MISTVSSLSRIFIDELTGDDFLFLKAGTVKVDTQFLAAFVGTGLYLFQQPLPLMVKLFNLSVDVGDGDCAAFSQSVN